MNNPVQELQQTILDQCSKCVYFEAYPGSQEPDDTPFVSCKKNVFE